MRCRTGRKLNLEPLESRQLLAADLIISEFMAQNDQTIESSFGETSDWIEIYNDSDEPQDLNGWSLSDDPAELDKWTFSRSFTVPANGYVIVWASDRDRMSTTEAHTNFKLKSGGEYLALVDTSGDVVSEFGSVETEYPSQPADISFGVDVTGRPRYYLNPTPGEANDDDGAGLVEDTKFSVDRGFYTEAFDVTVASATSGATLVYTLDGSAPSQRNGRQIVGGDVGPSVTIEIDSTTTLRAMAYFDGWTSTNVDTQTYLFLDQIVRQTGDGLPDTWGHAGADYEMDQSIVDSSRYQDVIVDSLKSIPTVSLVSDIDNWFGRDGTGIYPSGQGSPRGVSMEMLFPETGDDLQVDGSVEIQGGSSTNRWKSDKLSMQVKFKREYGDAKLEYPIFGDEATDRFDTLILDARLNQAWHYGGGSSPVSQRERAQYTRDQFVANLQRELGGHAPHGQWVHLYLNGIYWGMHNLHERPDEHFAEAYLGGEEEDYDIIKHNSDVVNGGFSNYQDFINLVNQNTTSDRVYEDIKETLDVEQFINYMLTNFYVGNTDWAHHNWYASFNKESGEGKWRYHSWDAEHVLKGQTDDATGRDDALGPTHVHLRLMDNAEYELQFMDAVQEYFFNNGKLTPERATAMYQERLDEVYEAIVAESARWGDNHRSNPFTRDNEWVAERDRLLEDYFPNRTDIVIEQLRDRGFFHRYDAPRFSQHGGEIDSGSEMRIRSSGGTVFYTLDGSDPRTSETAIEYTSSLVITESVTLKTRALRGSSEWSAMTVAEFQTKPTGDFSGDGNLDAKDLDLLNAAVSRGSFESRFDLDGDEELDAADVDYWLSELADTRRGDANLDGAVNFQDFLILSTNFGKEEAIWEEGNFDVEPSVSFADFLLLSTEFGWRRDA